MNDWPAIADTVGHVLNGNAAGFFVLLLCVLVLGAVVRTLWKDTKQNAAEMRRDLDDCRKNHANCEAHTRVLTQALLDYTQGRSHEAKARAETLLEMPSRG